MFRTYKLKCILMQAKDTEGENRVTNKIKIDSNKKYFVLYTLVFAIVMLIVYGIFIIRGKSLVGANDSLVQHYPFMIKVKSFYEDLLMGREVTLLDFNSLMGLNNISQLNYYGLGNPLYLLTLLCPEEFMPQMYSFLSIFKMYLGGVAFSALCFQYKKNYIPTLIGAVLYTITPFGVSMMEQLSFLDVLYQLPLLIIGFNQILKGKKSKTFVMAVMISALSGYYFLYMMTIMLAVYGVFIIIKRNSSFKETVCDAIEKVASTFVHYLLGIMLAAPVFIPSLIGFFESFRGANNAYELQLLYEVEYYVQELIASLVYNSKAILTINFVFILIIGVLFTRKNKKKYMAHKWLFLIAVVGAQIPIVGLVMNGFAYPSNRWLFGLYLLIMFIGVELLNSQWKDISENNKVILCGGILLLGMIQPMIFNFSYSTICMSSEEIEVVADSSISDEIEENSRMEGDEEWWDNASIYHDVLTAQIYASTIPEMIMKTEMKWDLSSVENTSIIRGLDGRAELDALFNIKYFMTKNQNKNIPYGFVKVDTEEGKVVYKNKNELHFGYTYDTFMTESSINEETGAGISWNAMKSAIISEKDKEKLNISEVKQSDAEVEKANIREVTYDTGKTTVHFDNIKNSEIYVKLKADNVSTVKGKFISEGKEKTFISEGSESVWYIDREYKLYNLGYFEELSEFDIICDDKQEDIEVYYHIMDDYEQDIEKLNQYHLENVRLGTNELEGSITVPENRLLCVSVPNINGWTAYIDGEETEIITVNGMFMGVMLPAGTHNISFEYFTPGLKSGLITFCIAIAIIIIIFIMERVRRNGRINGLLPLCNNGNGDKI